MEFKLKQLEREPVIVPEVNEEEVWKTSISFPLYEVSSFGRLRRIKNGYIMNPRINVGGYREASLTVTPGTYKMAKIHRLVAEVFCEGYDEAEGRTIIDHIDQCSYNNYYKNLRYVNKSENFYNGKIHRAWLSRTKVPVALVDKITNQVIETFSSIREASQKTGLNEDNIAYVIHRTRKPFKIGYFVVLEDLT